jgi:AcrR family transcriptional regulator
MAAPRNAALDAVRERPGGRSARIRTDVLRATRVELLKSGYPELSHRAVARRAGVDPTTVYRRWPTRSRLVADALLDFAGQTVPIPDTGTLEGDLTDFLRSVVDTLGDLRTWGVFQALAAVSADAEPDIKVVLDEFWTTRFYGAGLMVDRAVGRGEVPVMVDPASVIEALVAPAYFRCLITGAPLDAEFIRRGVRNALAIARNPEPSS